MDNGGRDGKTVSAVHGFLGTRQSAYVSTVQGVVMSRSLFGTDGVRGRANSEPMTAEIAMRIGMAVGQVFNRGGRRVVIGKDTRLSGYMI